jgi:cell division protein FtsQ
MKRIVQRILLWSAVVLCVGAVMAAGCWSSAKKDEAPCKEVCIVLRDSMQRQYVDADELAGYLKRHAHYPLGSEMHQVDCHAIEQCLLGHEMVRQVACYKSPFGKVYVDVEQREPMLYVVSNDGSYYVDSDRKPMPLRRQIAAELPTLKGAVSQRAATEEYYDFVMWLMANRYWFERVGYIHVKTPKHIVLTQKEQKGKIILGDLEGYEEKLARLRKLYGKAEVVIDSVGYREYDLRFDGQVVARR